MASAMHEQIEATLGVMGEQVPELAANLTVPPETSGGASWSGTGLLIPLRGTAAIMADGTQIRDGYSAIVLASAFEVWVPEPGRLMRVQVGDDAAQDFVIRDRQPDAARSAWTFTLEKQYA